MSVNTSRAWLSFFAGGLLLSLFTGCGNPGPPPVSNSDFGLNTVEVEPPPPDVKVPFQAIQGAAQKEAKALSGMGATFPQPLYKVWFKAYEENIGVKIDYQGTGSGSGIKAISNKVADFGASDAPMTDQQLQATHGGEVLHIPTALGAIVLAYNLPPSVGKLNLSGPVVAAIYTGEIRRWDDPRLVAENPQLAAQKQEIISLHRADGSGTTFGFTRYLSAVSPGWRKLGGSGTSVFWPIGLGGNGNGGVARLLTANPYSIGYLEWGYARRHKLAFARIRNRAGQPVDPTLTSIRSAASAIAANVPSDLRFTLINPPGVDSYPICTATWLLVYKNQTDVQTATALTRMLWWAIHDGQAVNAPLDYAPVPPELTARSEALIRQITVNGNPAFPGR